jgi:DNA modification methylase
MNELKIISVPLSDIKPFAKNAKLHPKEQVTQIVASIKEYGFNDPIAISEDNEIIEGHGRLLAVKELGYTEIPCIRLSHLTEAQRRAYILAHNKLTMNSGFDTDLLLGELAFLKDNTEDISAIGFSGDELDKLFGEDKKDVKDDDFDVDKAVSEPPFALTGDLWYLKNHRLLIGDSTKPEDVSRLMNGKKANLLLTDFPYNVNYEGKAGKIQNDNMSPEKFYDFLLTVFKNIETALDDEASAYVFHSDTNGESFRRAFREAGFKLSGVCQWVKPSLVLGRSPYQWQNEPCLFGWKAKGKHKWYAGRSETTIWNFDKTKKNDIHPTIKPLPLLAYPIKNSSTVNNIVLDVFSGSFSTGMACEQTDRICYAMELDEKYASASIKRFVAEYGADGVTVERGSETFSYTDIIKETL